MIFYDFLSGGNVRDFKTRHVGRISTRQKEKEDGGEIVKTDNRDEMEQRGRKNLVPEQTNVTNVSSRKLLSCIAYSKVSCNSCLIYCFNVNRLVVQGLLIKCSLKCLFMSTVD